eukprot:5156774-Pleurochrysis_carterae.AAC.2
MEPVHADFRMLIAQQHGPEAQRTRRLNMQRMDPADRTPIAIDVYNLRDLKDCVDYWAQHFKSSGGGDGRNEIV